MKFKNEAIPKHTTATTDAPWDSGENVKRISNDEGEETMRKMYAWVDPDKDPDTKGAYKFPHHMVSTAGKVEAANIKACQSVIAVLNGSRGGADIPDKDRQGVYDHAAGHLKDAGEEPAELQNSLNLIGFKPQNNTGKFWQFRNTATPGVIELLLYGEIKSEKSWIEELFGSSGIYAAEFVRNLQAMGDINQITCRINSPGGDIFAAVAIYTQLKTHNAKVICIVDGIAASAATFLLMAADEIRMPNGAMVMIHDPLAGLMGMYRADELMKMADTLNAIKESIISIYVERTKTSRDDLLDMMSKETWMTADEAIENGFCDKKIEGNVKIKMKGTVAFVNNVEHDLSGFKNLSPLQHAENILGSIAGLNMGEGIAAQFVAMAQNKGAGNPGKPDPDETDNPDTDPEESEKDKKGKKKDSAKSKNEDETVDEINDDDAEEDEDEEDEEKGKKAKKANKAVKDLMNKFPKTCALIVKNAKADERQRIQEIDRISSQVSPALAAKAKYETGASAKDLLYENALQSQGRGQAYLNSFRAQTETSGVKEVGAAPNTFTDRQPEEERAVIGDFIANSANNIMKRGGR